MPQYFVFTVHFDLSNTVIYDTASFPLTIPVWRRIGMRVGSDENRICFIHLYNQTRFHLPDFAIERIWEMQSTVSLDCRAREVMVARQLMRIIFFWLI